MRCIACDQDGVVLSDGCFVCNHCNIHIMPFRKGIIVPDESENETEKENELHKLPYW